MRTRRRGRWLPKQPRLGARMCQGTFFLLLQQRCNQTQHALSKLHRRRLLLRILLCYFPAHRENIFKILSYLLHSLTPMQKNAIFKMEIQTSIIQVDRADRRCHIVADALLCVEKARCILKNPHTRRRQLCIIGARYPINELFVRDARRNNPHIHTALRCQAQLPAHLIADNQIRRCEINIFGSRLYNCLLYTSDAADEL